MSKSNNGKGPSPIQQMYEQIKAVHATVIDIRRAAEHAAKNKNQISVPGQPVKQVGINIPKLVVHLEAAVHFLADQCLMMGTAIARLQKQAGESESVAEPESKGKIEV